MERYAKPKQLSDVAKAYANVTKHALEQDDINLAEATLRRSLKVSKSIDNDRLETLQFLSTICFTKDLASEIYYEVGLEMINAGLAEALEAFKISNAFASDSQNSFYSKSLYQIAKLMFEEEKLSKASQQIETALNYGLNNLQVDGLVLSGQIKEVRGYL